MKGMTKRQEEVLEFLKSFYKNHKFPPTIREVSSFFSISVKGAYDHVKALEKKGIIRCDLNRSRAIEILELEEELESESFTIPLLGSVAAGKPLFAEENFDRNISLPMDMLRKGKQFALRVSGESMIGAGILHGDTAVFVQQSVAENGDIVVAAVDEAITLKRFFREKNRIKLQAENPDFNPIYSQNVRIIGKLVGVIRNYA